VHGALRNDIYAESEEGRNLAAFKSTSEKWVINVSEIIAEQMKDRIKTGLFGKN
jgi:hypothetical protein